MTWRAISARLYHSKAGRAARAASRTAIWIRMSRPSTLAASPMPTTAAARPRARALHLSNFQLNFSSSRGVRRVVWVVLVSTSGSGSRAENVKSERSEGHTEDPGDDHRARGPYAGHAALVEFPRASSPSASGWGTAPFGSSRTRTSRLFVPPSGIVVCASEVQRYEAPTTELHTIYVRVAAQASLSPVVEWRIPL